MPFPPQADEARPNLIDYSKLQDNSSDATKRLHAAFALADLGEAPQEFLLDTIPTVPAAECRNLVAALAHVKEAVLPELVRRAESGAEHAEQARYAIVALHLGNAEPAKNALAVRGEPIHRTTLIHAYAPWHGDVLHESRSSRITGTPMSRSPCLR